VQHQSSGDAARIPNSNEHTDGNTHTNGDEYANDHTFAYHYTISDDHTVANSDVHTAADDSGSNLNVDVHADY
jgi:hypothetical protein